MSYKEVAGSKRYVKYKECDAGDVLVEGIYKRDVIGKYGVQYEFEALNGDIVVLNSAGQLNYKMDFISENTKVKIIYDGEITLESGAMKGKTAHQFKVLRDSSYDGEELGIEGDEGFAEAMDAGDDVDGLTMEDLF